MTQEPAMYLDTIREVELLTPDRDRLGRFYADVLGLVELTREPGVSVWGPPATMEPTAARAATTPRLRLVEDPRARLRPPGTVGLFHMAFLLPDRAALAMATRRLLAWTEIESAVQYHGYSEHGVSEAIYGNDPDGNGVELTCDHPYEHWSWSVEQPGGRKSLAIFTRPLDLRTLLREASAEAAGSSAFSHLHLQVSDLALAERLFVGTLGTSVVQRSFPGALFLAYGDYHHHVGANVWASRAAKAPPPGTTGLLSFTLRSPAGAEARVPVEKLSH